jgi:hypothetical protein
MVDSDRFAVRLMLAFVLLGAISEPSSFVEAQTFQGQPFHPKYSVQFFPLQVEMRIPGHVNTDSGAM